MKNIKGIILGLLVFALIIGGIMYFKANEKVEDVTQVKAAPENQFRSQSLLDTREDKLTSMEGKVVIVVGLVHSNEGSETERTITLGMDDMNLVVCQIDNRHLADAAKPQPGVFVKLKGTLSGHDFDDILGKSVQIKNCVLN